MLIVPHRRKVIVAGEKPDLLGLVTAKKISAAATMDLSQENLGFEMDR